jgi:hypothetical protein
MMPNSRDQGPEEDRRRGEFEASTIRAEVGVTEAGKRRERKAATNPERPRRWTS